MFPHPRDRVNIVMGTVLTFLLALSLYFALSLPPKTYGDGHEYIVQLWALASHASPEIRESDIESLSSYLQDNKLEGFKTTFLSDLKAQISSGGGKGTYFFRDLSGRYYGLHFWLYPALCVPAKWVLQAVHANELKAFQVTNVTFIAFAVAMVLRSACVSMQRRLTILLLFYGVGISYYFRWPHPEIFSAAACLVASVAFLEKRLLVSTFACGLCAIQNPSAALMIPVIFASQMDSWLKTTASGKCKIVGQFVLAGGCSLLPFGFYQMMYGTPSLIARERYLLLDNVDLSRMFSLLFDLNQGMVVGAGWVMGLAGLGVLMRCFARIDVSHPTERRRLFRREDWLIAAMALMALGVLPQVNWNSGQSVFTRYAFWLCVPLVVWAASQWGNTRLQQWGLRGVIVMQLLTVYIYGGFSSVDEMSSYIEHKRLPGAVLNYVPWVYNPEPEIFAERTLGREVDFDTMQKPIVYRWVRDGSIKKILVQADHLEVLSEEVCGRSSALLTQLGEPIRPSMVRRTRSNFVYISGSFRCFTSQ